MARSPETDTISHLLLRYSQVAGESAVRITIPGSPAMHIHFDNGHLTDVIPEEAPSLLESAIMHTDSVSDRDRKRLRKISAQEHRDMGELAIRTGLVSPEDLGDLIVTTIAEKIGQLMAAGLVSHEPADPADPPPVLALSEVFQLALPIESLLIAAAGTRRLWTGIRDYLPCLKEVYGARPAAFSYVEAPQQYPIESQIVQRLDGVHDVADIIDSIEEDPFFVFDIFQDLIHSDHVEPLNPVQLFQLGCQFEGAGNIAKALRMFERAEQRGLDDFDLGFRLGELYQQSNRPDDALVSFHLFAEKCISQFRVEDTIRTCRKILELDPGDLQVQERLVSLLARYGGSEEAIADGIALARRLEQSGEMTRAKASLEQIIELADANEEVLGFYLALCESIGDEIGTARARRLLGELFHQRQDLGKALELYQGMFVNGEDTAEVRSRLTELHFLAGNGDKARDHLRHLERMHGWGPRSASAEAIDFFRRLVEQGVQEPEIAAWLVDEAHLGGREEEVQQYLELHSRFLEAQGDLEQARLSAERLVRRAPLNAHAAQHLASLEVRVGNEGRAAVVLEQLAHRLAEDGTRGDELHAILQELVAINPLSLQGRNLLLPHSEQTDSPEHSRLLLETALLKLVAGHYTRAEALLSEIHEGSGLRTFFALAAAHLNLWHHERDKALIWFAKAGKLAAERGERYPLQTAIEKIKQIDPHHPSLIALERTYQWLPDPTSDAGQERGTVIASTQLSGITDRLKNLKQPDGEPQPAPESPVAPAPAPAAPAAPAAQNTPSAPMTPASSTVKKTNEPINAGSLKGADRLRALKQGAPAPTSPGTIENRQAPVTPPATPATPAAPTAPATSQPSTVVVDPTPKPPIAPPSLEEPEAGSATEIIMPRTSQPKQVLDILRDDTPPEAPAAPIEKPKIAGLTAVDALKNLRQQTPASARPSTPPPPRPAAQGPPVLSAIGLAPTPAAPTAAETPAPPAPPTDASEETSEKDDDLGERLRKGAQPKALGPVKKLDSAADALKNLRGS